MSWISRFIKIIAANLIVLVSGLFVVEGYWRYSLSSDITLTLNVLKDTSLSYDISNLYESRNTEITYTRNFYGLRGSHLFPSSVDVLVVGGSTTDQRYIDDSKEWVRIFQYESGLISANSGVDGQSTFGHLKNFEFWFPKIPGLKPKVTIFYVGINDFYKDEGHSYDGLYAKDIERNFDYYWTTSHLYFLKRLIEGLSAAVKSKVGHGQLKFDQNNLVERALLDTSVYEKIMANRLREYKTRLEALVFASEAIDSIPIFVTQSTLEEVLFRKYSKAFSYQSDYGTLKINGLDRVYMQRLLNSVTLSVCDDLKGVVCIDLAGNLEFEKSDFYDIVHNTPEGAKKVGKFIAEEVLLRLKN